MKTKNDEIDMMPVYHQIKENDLFKSSNFSELDFGDLKLDIVSLKTGEILYRQGDSADSIYLVTEGEINLIKEQGFGKTHSCLSKNKFFGHEEYFLQTNRDSVAIALKDSCLVKLSKENIEILFSRDNSFLDNVKNPPALNSTTSSSIQNIIKELPGLLDKPLAEFPIEPKTTYDEQSLQDSNNNISSVVDSKVSVYNKIDLNKIKFEINTILKKFNQNLLLLEEEKNKLESLKTAYEEDNTKLLVEIEKLKEQEAEFISLDKEKTEILGRQSYRIIELEEENTRLTEIETGYLKKIEFLNEQVSKDESIIKRIEAEVKDKQSTIAKLEIDLEQTKNVLSDLNNTLLILTRKATDNEQVIKEQKTKLENSERKIEALNLELSKKETQLIELNKVVLKKDDIISLQIENTNRVKADLERANKDLETKDITIETQSVKINKQNTELLNSERRIEELTSELSGKETHLTELHKNLLNKNDIISLQIETTDKVKADLERAQKDLETKDIVIQRQSISIEELQKKLDDQKESEKNGYEYVPNQANRIAEYEDLLKNSKRELEQKEESLSRLNHELLENSEKLLGKETEINRQNEIITELKNEIVGLKKSTEVHFNREKEFEKNIADLEFHLSKANSKLISISEQDNEKLKLIEIKEKENAELHVNIKEISNSLNEKNNRINELDEFITQLKNELSESYKLIEEFNSIKLDLTAKTDSLRELENENADLRGQINDLKLQNYEKEKKSNLVFRLNEELEKLKSEEIKRKTVGNEKDKLIEDQKEQIKKTSLSNSELSVALASVKNNLEEELKSRDNQIVELKQKLSNVQNNLDENLCSEDQYLRTIENQAQKIAELKLLLNESTESKNNSNKNIREEKFVSPISDSTNVDKPGKPHDNSDIFSKSKLVDHSAYNSSIMDGDLEHYEYFDLDIINVNLYRATMDIAFAFNKLLQRIISTERNKVIVNLSNCEFIDSSIIGALVNNLKKATSVGGDLRLVGFHPSVNSMLELTRMKRVFESFKTIEEAIKSFD